MFLRVFTYVDTASWRYQGSCLHRAVFGLHPTLFKVLHLLPYLVLCCGTYCSKRDLEGRGGKNGSAEKKRKKEGEREGEREMQRERKKKRKKR